MSKQEILAVLADLYNPTLLVLSLALMGRPLKQMRWRRSGLLLVGFFGVAVVAYGIRYADQVYRFWERFGLDYSTHTATSIGMVIFLSYIAARQWKYFWLSLLSYAFLMIHLRYHTAMDILTTALVVAPLVTAVLMILHQFHVQHRGPVLLQSSRN